MTTRVSILGATGYGGGELLRVLLRHPDVEVVYATSRSAAGTPVGRVHLNLAGLTDLEFSAPDDDAIAEESEIVFGALPHGASAEVLSAFVDRGVRVIDLSGDFRLRDMGDYRRWYKREHPRPDLVERAVYGCPELNAERIAGAELVASPGCFATALNLALLPAARAGVIAGRVSAVCMTGSSGSGAEATSGTHHPTRAGTLRPYKVLAHQHTPEVVQLVGDAGSLVEGLDFTPVSAPLVRGILAVVSVDLTREFTSAEAADLYETSYVDAPFVKVLGEREPECGPIAGTNYVEVRARVTEAGRLHVVSAIDNLVKGGAGQAVQSLNLMLGVDETTGLDWPGSWP